MKIITWNVNGLRAIERKGYFQALLAEGADIICLQETKSSVDKLNEHIIHPHGYNSFFHDSQERKGYAGTAIYTSLKPEHVQNGLSDPLLDKHGRIQISVFKSFILINGYYPNGKSKTAPLDFKLAFYDQVLKDAISLQEKKPVILTGDFNVGHEPIDLARPKENENTIGFLPEERAWIDEVIHAGWIDVFRNKFPQKQQYTYWDQKTRSRDRNIGWRIDYFFVPQQLIKKVKSIKIMEDFLGSDHAPVILDIEI